MRKSAFCICENKDADQLRGNREADQRLCFRYTDSIIPLLSKSEISSVQPSSVVVQPGLCGTRSETLKTGFLTTRLIYAPTIFFRSLRTDRSGFWSSQTRVYTVCNSVSIFSKHDSKVESLQPKS